MNSKAIVSAALSLVLCVGMAVPARAFYDPMREMEERSRRAVATAIQEGKIPPDKTIYDCGYGEGANGETCVVRYKDENGVWIDVATGKPRERQPADADGQKTSSAPAKTAPLTEETLKEYAAEVFRLVNVERRKAGLADVAWDDDFAACARIRAEELQYRYSHYRPVEPTTGSGEWPELTHGKKGYYNCPSVADEQGVDYTWVWENIVAQRKTPEAAVKAWMDSAGHRDNILMESHARCGVGVFYTEQKSPEGHNWYWVIWFDE